MNNKDKSTQGAGKDVRVTVPIDVHKALHMAAISANKTLKDYVLALFVGAVKAK